MRVAVEGSIDRAIASRLALWANIDILSLFELGGKPRLLAQLDAYNRAAAHGD